MPRKTPEPCPKNVFDLFKHKSPRNRDASISLAFSTHFEHTFPPIFLAQSDASRQKPQGPWWKACRVTGSIYASHFRPMHLRSPKLDSDVLRSIAKAFLEHTNNMRQATSGLALNISTVSVMAKHPCANTLVQSSWECHTLRFLLKSIFTLLFV